MVGYGGGKDYWQPETLICPKIIGRSVASVAGNNLYAILEFSVENVRQGIDVRKKDRLKRQDKKVFGPFYLYEGEFLWYSRNEWDT